MSTWDGRKWTTVVGKGFGQHREVTAGASGDLWIAGARNGRPVLHHFDGHRWTTASREVHLANARGSAAVWLLEGHEMVSGGRNDVWALGNEVAHWNGGSGAGAPSTHRP